MKKLGPKVSIVGCGNVGMRYAYSLVIKNIARSIVMIDIDKEKTEGESMDLKHASSFSEPVDIIAGEYKDMEDSDVVVITAGKNQKPGQKRSELILDNYNIFKEIVPRIMESTEGCLIIVATNPVDALTYLTIKLSGQPPRKVIGSGTLLDTARLKNKISELCSIDHNDICAYVLGEHGESEFVAWSRVSIGGMPFRKYCSICDQRKSCDYKMDIKNIFTQVKDSAKEIIQKKGETSYAIGLSLAEITESVLMDKNSIIPVSSYVSEGFHGIKDICMSLPRKISSSGAGELIDIDLDRDELKLMQKSWNSIKDQIAQIGRS